jgi:hypothetical protein
MPIDEDEPSKTMQETLLEADLKPIDDGTAIRKFQTNQGRVIFSAPQDEKRSRIMAQAQPIRPTWGNPSPIPRAVLADKELDVDWIAYLAANPPPVEEAPEEATEVASQATSQEP